MAGESTIDHFQTEPLPRDLEAVEARIRVKLDLGRRLTREERMFFARMPADKAVQPDVVKRRP
jgi:hypothetical protein